MLEPRLAGIAAMVDNDARIADIGTDHAYLPIDLVANKRVSFAIASDVAAGPLNNAKSDIERAGLVDKIQTRLGSGLQTITNDDHIDTVIIAGMGGRLIVDLLDEAPLFPTLILEPNVGEPLVRKWLMDHQYQIVDEQIIDTAGHIYELIKAKLTNKVNQLSPEQIEFGPFLLQQKSPAFIKKWRNQLNYQLKLKKNLLKAHKVDQKRITEVNDLIEMIRRELQ